MRRRMLAASLFAVPAAALALIDSPRPAAGCAVAPRQGSHVDVATETAVIVWDEPAKTQHFIRTASFRSDSSDFGFLVPTPSQPEVKEASADGFEALEKATAPRVEVRMRNPEIGCGAAAPGAAAGRAGMQPAAAPGEVQVLEQSRVGAFDYAVLKAEDPKKLHDWLEQNGYDARPELAGWLKAYTENNWLLTAFKVASDVAGKPAGKGAPLSVSGSVVRMSFRTDRPYFPYREPEDQRAGRPGLAPQRLLRVYLLADARFAGKLGDAGSWPGGTVWANRIDRGTFEAVAKAGSLPDGLAGRDWWLTEFEDHSSPRPGTDEVYFARSPEQGTVERPPIIVYEYRQWPVWVALAATILVPLLVVLVIALLVWRMSRRR